MIPSPLDTEYAAARAALCDLWCRVTEQPADRFTELAARIEAEFHRSMNRVAATDIAHVLEKRGDRAIRHLEKNPPEWALPLGKQVRLLVQVLRRVLAGEFRAPWKTMAAITAMMLYLVNPLDILPDKTPGIGLVDDALVIALCVVVVRRDLVRYAKEFELKLEDYGL
jgi:uncharacterized membrane protein YkvA (DUF1232 family)